MAKNEEVWVTGSVINFEQKRKERAEQEAERLADQEYDENGLIRTLGCTCGSVGLVVYTDGEFMMAECVECGMPMLAQLFMFLQGEI